MSSTARRMVVIGLDAADLSLVEHWSDEGLLPAFARLREKGTWIRLNNRGEFPSTSVWPSIYTGTHPGKNGIYYLVRVAEGKPNLELVYPEDCREPPFWVQLEAGGVRPVVVDVPFTHPIPGLQGVQIANWGSYERYGPAKSEPPEALRDIRRRFGPYPFGDELSRNAPRGVGHFRRMRRKLLSGVTVKGEMISTLMRDRAWDFFMAVFAETHPAGHYFWAFQSSPSNERLDPELKSTLLDVYKRIDSEIGRVAASLDGKTNLLIVSGHGIGPNHVGWHLLPDILDKMGLSLSTGERSDASAQSLLLHLRQSVPLKWRDAVSRSLPNKLRDYLRIFWATSTIEWRERRAISLPTDAHGFIRISVKGRDAEGHIDAGPDYEHTCRQIGAILRDLFDPETGKPVVDEVFLTDQIFPGPARNALPDLIVSWQAKRRIETVASKKLGTISGILPDRRSGNHRPDGFALLCGPGITKGQESNGHLLDIAPTVLSFYGHELPGSFDGRPWTDLLS